ncbi:SURF1 family protein [Pseudoduganella sp. CY13W]|uniref:SURF1-like protein n=1 Tax=Duganella qianjiadongensis TaxID=2692176 RepID=A0ABW9VLG3_9BURK|nr:SURF1 family protein [Duganella qianjiadongensis]MYM39735.1 SURF1 family protein [Duganella qianjiadongensis]
MMTTQSPAPQRNRALRVVLLAIASLLCAGFFALGTWQVYRLQWKLDLIERVNQRVHAEPDFPPPPSHWAQISAASDEYRHVLLNGVLLYELTSKVQAVTSLGSGYWLMTPLCLVDGSVVLVNRGYVTTEAARALPAPAHATAAACKSAGAAGPAVAITGLLRLSEARGGFLRANEAAAGRWYSRDVTAMAQALGLSAVAPYFVDADAAPGQQLQSGSDAEALRPSDRQGAGSSLAHPVGGLTVISFPNNHLVYAVTWYGLALMVAGITWWMSRDARRWNRA